MGRSSAVGGHRGLVNALGASGDSTLCSGVLGYSPRVLHGHGTDPESDRRAERTLALDLTLSAVRREARRLNAGVASARTACSERADNALSGLGPSW